METTVERTAPPTRGPWAFAAVAAFVPFSLDSVVLAAMFVVILAAFVTYLIYRGSTDGTEDEPSTQETPVRDPPMEKEPTVEPAPAPKRGSGSLNTAGRTALFVALAALVVAAGGLTLSVLGAQPQASAAYTPTTVHLQIAVVPDLQGSGWDVWLPNELVVHQGDQVVLTILNSDTMEHSFKLTEFNVDATLRAASVDNATGDITPSSTQVTFTATTVGTFQFYCNIYCGPGHDSMVGEFVVLADD